MFNGNIYYKASFYGEAEVYKVDLRSGGCPCKNSGHEAVSLNLCQQESFSSQHECPVFLEPRPPHTVFRVL